jgi:hypothetical protein
MIDRIRETLARYFSGEIDADDVAAFMPDPWELAEANADDDLRRLVLRIVGYITEFQNGNTSEPDLEARLRLVLPSARTYWIAQAEATSTTRLASSTGVTSQDEFAPAGR